MVVDSILENGTVAPVAENIFLLLTFIKYLLLKGKVKTPFIKFNKNAVLSLHSRQVWCDRSHIKKFNWITQGF